MWPSKRITDLLGIELPIIQAPMAGAMNSAMVIGACQAGALGSLPCAMLTSDKIRAEVGVIRQQTQNPVNLNFFCHTPTPQSEDRQAIWKEHLGPYYDEFDIDPDFSIPAGGRKPFDEADCVLVEELNPDVVSFHFGLPSADLVTRVKQSGARILSSATTAAEAKWLEDHGVDAIIAQGYEAGGHRGMFLTENVSSQAGTMALVPQVIDAVSVPVIAAGGITDGRGIAAAFALGASAAQIGTAYLFTPEVTISDIHRQALSTVTDDQTMLTNVFSGRPARSIINRLMREIGPISDKTPPFPTAGSALAPLKAAAEKQTSGDFGSLWSGQAASLGRPMSSHDLTKKLAEEALQKMKALSD